MSNVEKLYEGDQRLQSLTDAIVDVLHERGEGLPIPSIIGSLEIAKQYIMTEALED